MTMLKKLKGLFIIEEEEAKKSVDAKVADVNPTPKGKSEVNESLQIEKELLKQQSQPVKQESAMETPNASRQKAQPSEKFVNKLLGAMEANNVDGFDYIEFKQALQNLDSVQMDDATRYKSAIAMAKTMGADVNKLLSSAQHYMKVLNSEESKFKVAFEKQQQAKVTQQQDSKKKIAEGIKARKERILQLQDEVKQLEERLASFEKEVEMAKTKVLSTKDGFYAAYHIIVDQIENDIKQIQANA